MKNYFTVIVLLILVTGFQSYAQNWIPASETNFDFRHIRRLQAGPSGHLFALDNKWRLALIRFDTAVQAGKSKIQCKLVKVIALGLWPGFKEEIRQFDFSAVSEDGRFVALHSSSRKITGRNSDGSPALDELKEELLILDFAEQKIEFRTETGKKSTSSFFGQRLRYTELREGNLSLMEKDPEETKPKFLKSSDPITEKSLPFGLHIGIGNQGFGSGELLNVRDDIHNITIQLGSEQIRLLKENKELFQKTLSGPSDVEIYRFREFNLIHIQAIDSLILLNPKNGDFVMLPGPKLKLHPQTGFLNGRMLVSFSRGAFSFYNVFTGKLERSSPVKLLPGINPEIPRLANSGPDRLIRWKSAGKQLRFNLRSRQFQMEKIAANDTSIVQFPVLNSRKFRTSSTRFSEIEDTNSTDNSAFSPGVYLNGNRIGSTSSGSPDDFMKFDISDKAGMVFLLYNQPRLIALNPEIKKLWISDDFSGRLLGVKADNEGNSLYTISENGIVDFFNAKTGIKYLSMTFDSSGREWILWTPSGYFDASTNGEQLLAWMPPSEQNQFPGLFSMSCFRKDFRHPELVDAVMLCRDEKEALTRLKTDFSNSAMEKKRQAALPASIRLEFPGDRFNFTTTELRLPFFVIKGRLPLKKIQISLDGKALPDHLPDGKDLIQLNLPAADCILELIPISAAGEGEKIQCKLFWKPNR